MIYRVLLKKLVNCTIKKIIGQQTIFLTKEKYRAVLTINSAYSPVRKKLINLKKKSALSPGPTSVSVTSPRVRLSLSTALPRTEKTVGRVMPGIIEKETKHWRQS